MRLLKVKNLNKHFRDLHVLQDININAEPGQIYGLVGSNGCGKTTLLKHIMNLYKKDSGDIRFNDIPVDEYSDTMTDFYYVQDDLYFPYQYSLDKLFNYEKLLYPHMSREKYDKLVEYFGIDHKKNLNHLSKGQRKQAAFI